MNENRSGRPSSGPTSGPTSGPAAGPESTPWWRVRMVWLVIGGPLAVVIASFATLGLAIRFPDPVLATRAAATSAGTSAATLAEMPAVQARNHAATPQR